MEEHSTEADGSNPGAHVRRVEMPVGWIDNLDVHGYVSVLLCLSGTRRSSHYHKNDEHWLYVVNGYMDYWERPVGSDAAPTYAKYKAGEMVFTGPMVEHWTEFPVGATLISVSKLHRTDETHEADVVRVPWFE